MSTIFPLSASVGQIFEGYQFNGTTWDIIGIDLTANYPEILEGKISASVIPDIFATNEYVDGSAISASAAAVTYLVDSAPETLNTLNELAAALGDDANFATTVTNSLSNKLDTSSASSTYLTQVNASTTYQPLNNDLTAISSLSQSSGILRRESGFWLFDSSPYISTPPSGFRNRIINGDFRINQRGYTSGSNLSSGSYGFDRWKSTFTNTTLTFTSAPQGQMITINSGGSIEQIIERANMPAGSYILSWTGTATGRVYNTGATPPTYAESPITVTLNGSANVEVEFTASGGARTLQNVQLEQSLVSINASFIATPFEYRPIGTELSLCHRYYYKSPYIVVPYILFNQGNVMSGTYQFPVTMRVAPPSITYYDGANTVNRISIANTGGTAQNNITPPNALNIFNTGWNFGAGGMGGTTGNDGNIMLSSYEASAEL
jgi:hypothetical protein